MIRDFFEEIIIPVVMMVLLAMFITFIIVFLMALFSGPTRQEEMYQHCIDDGNKDYVCYQMTHVERRTTYVPTPVTVK